MTGRLFRLARALRGRSTAELRERVAQQAAARAERHGLGGALGLTDGSLHRVLAPGAPRDPERLLAAFRAAGRPRFFPGPADPVATARAVRAAQPAHEAATLARADRVLAGRFDLLGYEGLDYGAPIDWQLDPVTGRRAPLVHWSRVPYLDHEAVGDHKVTWEVNRQQYLVTLGQAWAYTGDERYAAGFARLVTEWLDGNPPKLGINWASSLEVAFRAMSWCWALHLFRDSPALTPALHARMLGSLHVHARHLERYLSTWFSPNTHLTGEALGLFHVGLLFPELRGAGRWRARGQGILEEWLPRHVRPDGVYFEQASQYHRYTTEFYTQLLVLAGANGLPLSPAVRPAVERLHEHLLHLARPDGTIPLVGDDDGGRLVQLDGATPDDVRGVLAVGAALTGSPELAFGARGERAYPGWLLGAEGLARLDGVTPTPPTEHSRAFADGGYYVSRSGWGPDAMWSVVDCGPHGAMNCGHAHADALAMEVAAGGRALLVDSGTYSYPGPERNRYRHGAAHNTVTVDGASSSEPASPFQWHRIAECAVDGWISRPGFDYFAGRHDGFATLPGAPEHRREVLFVRGRCWVVRDVVEGAGEHEVAVHWHAAPGLDFRHGPEGATDLVAPDGEGGLLLRVAVVGEGGELTVEPGWVSPIYGRREPARRVVFRRRGADRHDMVTLLLPAGPGKQPSCVRPLARVAGGRALAMEGEDGSTDLLLLGDGDVIEMEDVRTDARWLWLRRAADGTVTSWLALHASHAAVGGAELFPSGGRREWVAGDPMVAPAG